MTRYDNLKALLLANPDLTKLLDTSALIRLMPEGQVLVVSDSTRGSVDLEPGTDLVFAKVDDNGPSLGFNADVSTEDVSALIEAMPVEAKPWRFGSKPTGKVVVFGANGEKKVLLANTVVFDDNGNAIGLAVGDSGITVGLEATAAEQPDARVPAEA